MVRSLGYTVPDGGETRSGASKSKPSSSTGTAKTPRRAAPISTRPRLPAQALENLRRSQQLIG
jgi:hypothetical protein